MRMQVSRKPFLDAISLAGSVTPARSSKPILQDLKISTDGNGVEVLGTDLEVSVRCRVGTGEDSSTVSVEAPGTVVVAAAKLQAVIRELSAEQIELRADGRAVRVVSKEGDFRLFADDPMEFPQFPEFTPLDFLEGKGADLAATIDRVEFAAARDLGRYAVNGAQLSWDGEVMVAVATDGRRLAYVRQPMNGPKIPPRQAIVPLKGLAMFRKSLSAALGTVGLRIDGTMVALRTSRTEVSARVLEGDFPEYQDVITQEHPHHAEVPREDMLAAIRRASVVLGGESRSVRLEFSEGVLAVSAREEGSGEAMARIAIEYDGPAQEISVNPDFLLDFLKLPSAEKVRLGFDGSEKPMLCRPEESYLYVVMPVGGP